MSRGGSAPRDFLEVQERPRPAPTNWPTIVATAAPATSMRESPEGRKSNWVPSTMLHTAPAICEIIARDPSPRGLEQALAIAFAGTVERAADADHHKSRAVGDDLRILRLKAKTVASESRGQQRRRRAGVRKSPCPRRGRPPAYSFHSERAEQRSYRRPCPQRTRCTAFAAEKRAIRRSLRPD